MSPSTSWLTVDRVLSRAAARWPDNDAIVTPDSTMRYRDLEGLSRRFGRLLQSRGVTNGTRVAIILPNSMEFVVSMYAIARIGAVMVPLNPGYTDHEIAHILADAAVSLVICRKSHLDRVEELKHNLPVLAGGLQVESLAALIGLTEGLSHSPLNAPVRWDATHSILYTSGTTGRPKGAVLSHRSRVLNSLSVVPGYEFRTDSRSFCPTPLFHSGGLVIGLMSAVTTGSALIIGFSHAPDVVRELMERNGVNCLLLTPTLIRRLLDDHDFSAFAAGRHFHLLHGGAGMPRALAEQMFDTWPDCRAIHCYGATEAPQLTMLPTEEYRTHLSATGRALPGIDVDVCDSDGNSVEPGVVGEVVTSGPHILDEYLNNAEATEKVLKSGRFYTGDLATIDETGIITISGRRHDMIISGGYNVYSREVEDTLHAHPDVLHAAVFGIPDREWGEIVVAAIVPRQGHHPTEAGLIEFCRTRLISYKKPKSILFIDELPFTPSGKVQKFKLIEQFSRRLLSQDVGA